MFNFTSNCHITIEEVSSYTQYLWRKVFILAFMNIQFKSDYWSLSGWGPISVVPGNFDLVSSIIDPVLKSAFYQRMSNCRIWTVFFYSTYSEISVKVSNFPLSPTPMEMLRLTSISNLEKKLRFMKVVQLLSKMSSWCLAVIMVTKDR